jgi:hypothetical protein
MKMLPDFRGREGGREGEREGGRERERGGGGVTRTRYAYALARHSRGEWLCAPRGDLSLGMLDCRVVLGAVKAARPLRGLAPLRGCCAGLDHASARRGADAARERRG